MLKAMVAVGWVVFALALFSAFVQFLVDHMEFMALAFVVLSVMTIILAFEFFRKDMGP